MTEPPRAAATPYTRPAPKHWQSVDPAPHSRYARHTWTHCHPDSVRVGWWQVASSQRDTTKLASTTNTIEMRGRHAVRSTEEVREMRCGGAGAHPMPMPARVGRQHQPGQHQPMAQTPRRQTPDESDLPARRVSSTRRRGRSRAATQPRRRPLGLGQSGQPVPRASHRQERYRCAARPNTTTMTTSLGIWGGNRCEQRKRTAPRWSRVRVNRY